jgi:hypothetical protein
MKFSIRDLLLVTVIVALALGWHKDHRRAAPELEHYHRLLEVIGHDDGVFGMPPNSSAPAPNQPTP